MNKRTELNIYLVNQNKNEIEEVYIHNHLSNEQTKSKELKSWHNVVGFVQENKLMKTQYLKHVK